MHLPTMSFAPGLERAPGFEAQRVLFLWIVLSFFAWRRSRFHFVFHFAHAWRDAGKIVLLHPHERETRPSGSRTVMPGFIEQR